MEKIIQELKSMKTEYTGIEEIRNKDGVLVYRVFNDMQSYILKFFENELYRREIKNYEILNSLGLQTMKVISKSDKSLLLEDINKSEQYRLGVEDDLNDITVAKALARWYKQLHDRGKEFVSKFGNDLYSENDCITLENIRKIPVKTGTESNPVWTEIEINFDNIIFAINNLPKTITYNDFYYTNFIVAKDKSSAYMFDYNFLGKGYAYSDIRNVGSSLTEKANQAFLEAYGHFDKNEILVDKVASVLVDLSIACRYESFPKWVNETIDKVNNGEFMDAVIQLIHLTK